MSHSLRSWLKLPGLTQHPLGNGFQVASWAAVMQLEGYRSKLGAVVQRPTQGLSSWLKHSGICLGGTNRGHHEPVVRAVPTIFGHSWLSAHLARVLPMSAAFRRANAGLQALG